MAISVRLDRKTEALLDRLSRAGKMSKSNVIRESITEYAIRAREAKTGKAETVYDRLQPFIGCVRSGGGRMAGDWKREWGKLAWRRNIPDNPR